MTKRKSMKLAVLMGLLLGLALLPLSAQTPACGSDVSGTVVFDGPMVCTSEQLANLGKVAAINVVADGTTIDLNGFQMSCKEEITNRSCHGISVDQNDSNQTVIGINASGVTNVVIKGPGTIKDFDRSIILNNVAKGSVVDLEITGPTAELGPSNQSTGPLTTGIRVIGGSCPGAIVIDGNDVNSHRNGVVVQDSSCVKVQRNKLQGNRGAFTGSHGLWLLNSPGNTVTNNWVERNGLYIALSDSTAADAGIALEGALTTGNRVAQNTLIYNCGDGISIRDGAQDNPIGNNSATSNGKTDNRCRIDMYGVPVVQAYDFAEYGTPVSLNTWRKNNDCDTQNSVVPAGTCVTTLP